MSMLYTFKRCLGLLFVPIAILLAGANTARAVEVPPAPQLVTDAWMLIVGYEADPKAIKEVLPKGLEPHPNNRVVLNMYTVPDPKQTSGFGAYTLTYVTVEVKGQDSYTFGEPTGYPGRYFVNYFNSSEVMREFTKRVGIPAEPGMTTINVDNEGNLKAVLEVNGTPFIEATAKVGKDFTGVVGGHLNYFGLLKTTKDGETLYQVMKYPIPWVGRPVTTENVNVKFVMPKDHPLRRLAPKKIDWAVWIKGSFVYPQAQVLSEWTEKEGGK